MTTATVLGHAALVSLMVTIVGLVGLMIMNLWGQPDRWPVLWWALWLLTTVSFTLAIGLALWSGATLSGRVAIIAGELAALLWSICLLVEAETASYFPRPTRSLVTMWLTGAFGLILSGATVTLLALNILPIIH
jgi:hypothetical protein